MNPLSSLDPSVFKSRIFWKYFGAFLGVFLVTVFSIFFYLVPSLRTVLQEDIRSRLASKLLLLKGHFEVIDLNLSNARVVDAVTDQLARKHLIQISVIDENGFLVGDSNLDTFLVGKKSLQGRPEIIAAQSQDIGEFDGVDEAGVSNIYLASKLSQGFIRVSLPLEPLQTTRKIVVNALQLSFLPALMLSALLGFWLARKSTTSIKNVLDVASRISKGDFSAHYQKMGNDELNELGQMLNGMSKGLKEKLDELSSEKSHLRAMLDGMMEGVLVTDENGGVVLANKVLLKMFAFEGQYKGRSVLECFRNKDIYESILKVSADNTPLAQRYLIQTAEGEKYVVVHCAPLRTQGVLSGTVTVILDISDVRKLETFRREFVANVSHELKTPLTNIRGYAETLMGGAMEDTEMAGRFCEKILRNATQLQSLVEDLLELSTIESGKLSFHKQKITLETVVRALQSDYADWFKNKKLIFENRVSADLFVEADPQALKQILRNLLDNAIKYTPDGGQITIEAGVGDEGVWISIKDNGIGISEKDIGRIFERFFRSDQSRSRDMGGTGLGLAIVKHLISGQGWEIFVESKYGSGSMFKIIIPHVVDNVVSLSQKGVLNKNKES